MSVRLHRYPSLVATEYACAASIPAGTGLAHLAGICPLAPDGATIAPGDVTEQARVAVVNLRHVLADLGTTLRDACSPTGCW